MKTYRTLSNLLALGALLAVMAVPASAQDTTTVDPMMEDTSMAMQQPASAQTIVETIQQEPDLSTLAQALEQTGMINALRQGGPYTVFAPSNEAFEGLPQDLQGLIGGAAADTTGGQMAADTAAAPQQGQQQNRQALIALLRRHVVADNVTSATASNLNQAVTILGDTLDISAEGGEVMVGEATVQQPDLEAENGVIHIIDQVLVPTGGVDELVRLNQQQEQQGQQQGAQPPPPQDPMEEPMETDTTTFQPDPMEDDPMQDPMEDPMEDDPMETDTSDVNNR